MDSTCVNLVEAVVMNCFKSNSENLSKLEYIFRELDRADCSTNNFSSNCYGKADIQSEPIRVYCNAFACFTQPRINRLDLKPCHYKFINMKVVAPQPLFDSGFLKTVQHIV